MAAALVSLAGVFVAAYLYLYKIGKIGSLACGTGGCETVQLSRYARFLGIEVALIGLVGYAALFAVAVVSLQPRFATVRWPIRLLSLMSGVAVAFAAYLTWLEVFVIHAICRWCVVSAVLVTLIFGLALLDLRRSAAVERGNSG